MAENNTSIDPRYLSYDKEEVENILKSVEHFDEQPEEESKNPVTSEGIKRTLAGYFTKEEVASEEDVRSIVKNWQPKHND